MLIAASSLAQPACLYTSLTSYLIVKSCCERNLNTRSRLASQRSYRRYEATAAMYDEIQDIIDTLNEVELTILTCLVSGEHCIFSTASNKETLHENIITACRTVRGHDAAILSCNAATSIADLHECLTLHDVVRRANAQDIIADTVVLCDLDLTSQELQVQVIELLRTRRIYTHGSLHIAPKDFLLVITTSTPTAKLDYHLTDMIAASYTWQPGDTLQSDQPLFSERDIEKLQKDAVNVRLTAEVDAYLYDIVLYMRMSRFIQGGVSATATRHMRALCRAFAVLHGINFVTPSLVMLAARKVYGHRLVSATASTEKSLQWGSDPEAIEKILNSMTISQVIEDVIASVDTPL